MNDTTLRFGSANLRFYRFVKYLLILATTCLAAKSSFCSGVILGQTDTFQDGTTDGWGGSTGNSSNIATGGPAGSGDSYLQIVSGTFGGGPRMVTFNDTQWLGDYITAGVSEITMDLCNFGPSALPVRIAIREGSSGSSTPGYCSTLAYNLPADGQWHAAAFLLTAGNLTAINNPQPLAADLANVGDFRILSSVNPSLIGDAIAAEIGIDNIQATSVPEPGTSALLGAGLLGAWQLRRRNK